MRTSIPAVVVVVVAGVAAVGGAAGALAAEVAWKTCGQRTADDAVFPAKLAELFVARSDGHDAHAAFVERSTNVDDARPEIEGMRHLAMLERDLAQRTSRLAMLMREAHRWPPVAHDDDKLRADPKVQDAEKRAVAVEKDLAVYLEKDVSERERR